MFELEFSTDNAAFEDGRREEIARILRRVADDIERGPTDGLLFDVNGNRIGFWTCDDPEEGQ